VCHHTWLIFFLKCGSCCVAQTFLEVLGTRDPSAPASWVAGITGVHHWAYLQLDLTEWETHIPCVDPHLLRVCSGS
jgi:hypothetical protein